MKHNLMVEPERCAVECNNSVPVTCKVHPLEGGCHKAEQDAAIAAAAREAAGAQNVMGWALADTPEKENVLFHRMILWASKYEQFVKALRRTVGAEPVAVWEGTFTIFGVILRYYVLDDGRRMINAEDFAHVLRVMESGERVAMGNVEEFARWQKGQP
jgi:hypothetical protein